MENLPPMKKLNLLLIYLFSLQQSIFSGPVISRAIDDSLHAIEFFINDYIEQQKKDLLFYAILSNDKKTLKQFVNSNNQKLLNTGDNAGNTSLHYAAESKSVSTINLLLLSGANPSIRNNNKELPFDIAMQSRQSEKIIEKLSPESKNIRRKKKGQIKRCY